MNPREAGFTYVAVLFAVAFMGLGLALTGGVWHTALAREREVQLLYAGNQYRRAIERYYLGGPRQYPRALDGIMGVYSLSEDSPKKVANFGFANREFEGAAKYSDWKFLYNPAAQVPIAQQLPVPGPGTQPAPIPQQPVPDPGNPSTQQPPVPQSAK